MCSSSPCSVSPASRVHSILRRLNWSRSTRVLVGVFTGHALLLGGTVIHLGGLGPESWRETWLPPYLLGLSRTTPLFAVLGGAIAVAAFELSLDRDPLRMWARRITAMAVDRSARHDRGHCAVCRQKLRPHGKARIPDSRVCRRARMAARPGRTTTDISSGAGGRGRGCVFRLVGCPRSEECAGPVPRSRFVPVGAAVDAVVRRSSLCLPEWTPSSTTLDAASTST